MQISKFVEIFDALSKIEQNRFRKWVHSPYHNQKEQVKNLLDYLLGTKKYSLEAAHQFVFKKQLYKPQRIRNVLSYLQKILEDFLLHEALEQTPQLK